MGKDPKSREKIGGIDEEGQISSLIVEINLLTEGNSDDKRYAKLSDYAQLLWNTVKLDNRISGGFNIYDADFSDHVCDDENEFKKLLFLSIFDSEYTIIVLNESDTPQIYQHVDTCFHWGGRKKITKEKNTILEREWYNKLDELCNNGADLFSEDYLNEIGGMHFNIFGREKQEEYFDYLWNNQIKPNLYPQNLIPNLVAAKPMQRLAAWALNCWHSIIGSPQKNISGPADQGPYPK